MTTTQAQIEALRKAAIACTEAANALTTAAEVGHESIDVYWPAAAEVGKQERHDSQVERYVIIGDMRQQTIERCAKEAKQIMIYLLDLHEDELTKQQRSFIVDQFERKFAAALKDKP